MVLIYQQLLELLDLLEFLPFTRPIAEYHEHVCTHMCSTIVWAGHFSAQQQTFASYPHACAQDYPGHSFRIQNTTTTPDAVILSCSAKCKNRNNHTELVNWFCCFLFLAAVLTLLFVLKSSSYLGNRIGTTVANFFFSCEKIHSSQVDIIGGLRPDRKRWASMECHFHCKHLNMYTNVHEQSECFQFSWK